MRVLLAVHAFPPRSTAGTEVYTLRLGQALQALGHEVRVLSAVHDLADRHGQVRRRSHAGLEVAEVVSNHEAGTVEGTYADATIAAAAGSVVDGFAPDCVHIQHLLNLASGIVAQARRGGARVVMTLHDHWLGCFRDGLRMREDLSLCRTIDHAVCAACVADSPYLTPAVQRGLAGAARRAGLGGYLHRVHDMAPRATGRALAALRTFAPAPRGLKAALDQRARNLRAAALGIDALVAPTRFVGERAVEWGAPADRVTVRGLGAVAGPTRARGAGPRRRIGYIGAIAPHKGVHVLVEAFRRVTDPGITLDVHGSLAVAPAYVESLRRAAAGDPRIRFHGGFAEGEQARILAGLDLVVVPSVWWENSPLVVLEALAEGVPVVASAIGGLPEIVPDGAGLLVPPGDVGALSAVIVEAVAGRVLADALPPLALKTIDEGARELLGVYASLFGSSKDKPLFGSSKGRRAAS